MPLRALAAALLLQAGCSRPRPLAELTRPGLQEDVRFFGSELPRRHKNAFHHLPQADFQRAVAALDRDVPTLPPDAVVVRLAAIAAAVGDAHTRVLFPQGFHRFPLSLFWFGDDLRVVGAAAELRGLLGARILAIDDTPIEVARKSVDVLVSRDEPSWYELDRTPGYLMLAEALHAFGITRDPAAPARFLVDLGDTGPRTVTIAPVLRSVQVQMVWLDAPLLMAERDKSFVVRYLPEWRLVYVAFRGYDHLAAHGRELFALLDAHRDARLFIDMRQNGGGDFYVGRTGLVDPLRERPWLASPGMLAVGIGRATFSAGVDNAIDLKKLGAVLVGEPAGERPNGYQESLDFDLPHSGITVTFSTELYHPLDAPENLLMPDVLIAPSFDALRTGRDPVLEWFLAR